MHRMLASLVALLAIAAVPRMVAHAAGIPAYLLGRWDANFDAGGFSLPAWFEISQVGPTLEVKFQPSFGAPELIRGAAYLPDRVLSFETAQFGPLRGRFNGRWFVGELRAPAHAMTPMLRGWTAERAPDLPDRAVIWGAPERLFDGVTLDGWHGRHGREDGWVVRDGELVVDVPTDDLLSNRRYGDFKLHLQYRLQSESDSGVHLRGRYEIQLTQRAEEIGPAGETGSVYGHVPPGVRSAKPAGEWNTLDIVLVGRWLTATLNGQKIHDKVEIPAITGHALDSNERDKGPIMLQGGLGRVAFRDIVVTPAR